MIFEYYTTPNEDRVSISKKKKNTNIPIIWILHQVSVFERYMTNTLIYPAGH